MSHTAFLNTIREYPEADLPRLVYADYLDESGQPARAEFIRVQCELASLPDHAPGYSQLEDREHDLLAAHEQAWANELPAHATEWQWRRGFVEDVTFGLERFEQADSGLEEQAVSRLALTSSATSRSHDSMGWDHCQFLANVRHLDLTGLTFDQHWATRELVVQWFLQSAALPRLEGVAVRAVRPNSFMPGVLSLCPVVSKFTELSLSDAPPSPGESLVSDATRYHMALHRTRMKSLSLVDYAIGDTTLADLFRLDWTSTLSSLDVSGNPLSPEAYRAFEGTTPLPQLESLDVSGTPLAGISLDPLLASRATEKLTSLELNGCGSARRNMEVLCRSRFWTQATSLRAHSGTIPASTLEPLCRSVGPPALRLLDLADNYLRTDGVRMLGNAGWAASLTWLALSRNYLDDDSCRVLSTSHLHNLRTLHLSHNNTSQDRSEGEMITDIGVSWLTDSAVLANLRILTLNSTHISDRAVDLILNRAHWRLFGLGIANNQLTSETVRILASSPRLSRLTWLDLSGNPRLGGRELLPLAESPFLSRLCDLDCGGIPLADAVRDAFRERLGPRFSD